MSSLLKRLKNLELKPILMANDFYEKDWKTFLKCKECNVFKEINNDNWYSHNEWFLWVLWRCKECILKWRHSEHERKMAREWERDMDRYHNNPKRREYIIKAWVERRKRKGYWKIHLKTERQIKKLWIRPDKCPLCWYEWRVIAHHPNYDKRYEIAFCCQICHDKIHKWEITDYNAINLLNIEG